MEPAKSVLMYVLAHGLTLSDTCAFYNASVFFTGIESIALPLILGFLKDIATRLRTRDPRLSTSPSHAKSKPYTQTILKKERVRARDERDTRMAFLLNRCIPTARRYSRLTCEPNRLWTDGQALVGLTIVR